MPDEPWMYELSIDMTAIVILYMLASDLTYIKEVNLSILGRKS